MTKRAQASTRSSEERLWHLIEQRLKPGADKLHIDERIWDLFGEDWCVMFTDLSGFSRKVAQFGIIHFLQTIYESERLLVPMIEDYDGFLLKIEGDSLLAIFHNANKALECSLAMQQATVEYNVNRLDEEKMLLSIGLGHGPMLRVGDADVFGAEVNAASKLGEDIAGPGEILVTGAFRRLCKDYPAIDFEPLDKAPSGADSAYRVVLSD